MKDIGEHQRHEELRRKLEADVKRFLKGGGKIKKAANGETNFKVKHNYDARAEGEE